MQPDLKTYIERLRQCKSLKEKKNIQLDLVGYISDLGENYATNLFSFSDSVIRNKEEWYKKSMIECVHQAGRDVGYRHEANKVEIEAARALLSFICDMELEDQNEEDDQEEEKGTSPSTI